MAKKETKRERFVRVAEQRTQNVLDALRTLSKCSHPAVYEYNDKDLNKIFAAIEDELQYVKGVFAGLNRFSLSNTDEDF